MLLLFYSNILNFSVLAHVTCTFSLSLPTLWCHNTNGCDACILKICVWNSSQSQQPGTHLQNYRLMVRVSPPLWQKKLINSTRKCLCSACIFSLCTSYPGMVSVCKTAKFHEKQSLRMTTTTKKAKWKTNWEQTGNHLYRFACWTMHMAKKMEMAKHLAHVQKPFSTDFWANVTGFSLYCCTLDLWHNFQEI